MKFMRTPNILYIALGVLFFGYSAHYVFLADDALAKRTVTNFDENGGYERVTARPDGSRIVETYEVNADGTPKSHTLMSVGADPDSEPKILKKGTFVPKFKKES